MTATQLDSASIEAIAQRVAQLLSGEELAGELVDAAEIARRFGVSRDWVYRNAQRLGCVRLGETDKARLRFDPALVAQRLSGATPSASSSCRPGSRRRASSPALLPVKDA